MASQNQEFRRLIKRQNKKENPKDYDDDEPSVNLTSVVGDNWHSCYYSTELITSVSTIDYVLIRRLKGQRWLLTTRCRSD